MSIELGIFAAMGLLAAAITVVWFWRSAARVNRIVDGYRRDNSCPCDACTDERTARRAELHREGGGDE